MKYIFYSNNLAQGIENGRIIIQRPGLDFPFCDIDYI